MPEDQLLALPTEIRTMVMTGANAMMNQATANPGMMPGVMMDMSGMMGAMGMGMNGDMGMANGMMQGMLPDNTQGQQAGVGVVPTNGTPEQVNGVGMMQEGFNPNAMNMNVGGEYAMQVCSILYITPLQQELNRIFMLYRTKMRCRKCFRSWNSSRLLHLFQVVVGPLSRFAVEPYQAWDYVEGVSPQEDAGGAVYMEATVS